MKKETRIVASVIVIELVLMLVMGVMIPVSADAVDDERYSGQLMQDVAKIQEALCVSGYDIPIDGKYEAKTDAAVRNFQREMNLDADGICGVNTQKALGIYDELMEPGRDYLYTPLAGTGTEYRVVTNLNAARTTVYRWVADSWAVLVDTDCIVGAPGTETVTGKFSVMNKDEVGFVKNGYNYTNTLVFYVPNGDYTRAYCYHSLTKDKNGNELDDISNHYQSHGCIRIPRDALNVMFSEVPLGSTVRIY